VFDQTNIIFMITFKKKGDLDKIVLCYNVGIFIPIDGVVVITSQQNLPKGCDWKC